MTKEPPIDEQRHHTIRTVSLGTLWRLFRYPFITLSVAIIPRTMGDEVYGQYAFFMSVFLILDYLTDIGITQVLGRFGPEFEAKEGRYSSSRLLHGFLFYGMLPGAVTAAGVLLVPLVHPFEGFPFSWFAIMSVLLLATKFEGIVYGFLYGLNQIARFSSREVMRSAFTFVFVLLLYTQFGLLGAFWGLVVNEVLLSIVGTAWVRDYVFRAERRIPFALLRPYLFFGLRLYIPLCLFGLLQRSGNVCTQWLTGSPKQVAYFDIANQFLLLTATFLGLILTTLVPSLSTLYAEGRQEQAHKYQRTATKYCGIAIFVACNALVWLGHDAVTLIMGAEFAPAYSSATVMVLAVFPGVITYVGMNYALLQKEPEMYTWSVVVGLALMVLTSILLVPKYQALGAAWGSVCGYGAMGTVLALHYRKEFSHVLRDFVRVVLLGIPFASLYLFFRPPFPLAVAAFVGSTAVYLCVLFMAKLLSIEDARSVLDAFRRPSIR